jgi:heme-degrading monooxygenase HmoA
VFARVHTLETTPEQHDRGLEVMREQLLPWMRESSGFCGVIRLVSNSRGETLVITLWSDEDTLDASAEAGERLGALASETSGSVRKSMENYEVRHFEVVRRGDVEP